MPDGLIIAICGESGAGKSTTTTILGEAGFEAYSLSGFLRAEAEARYGKPRRDQVQAHGREMQRRHGNDYYARLLVERTDLMDQRRAVVDGLRNLDELGHLRQVAARHGRSLVLLALALDPNTRFERVRSRGRSGDPAERTRFAEDDARANGGRHGFQDNSGLIAAADWRVENTGNLCDLRAAVEALIRDTATQREAQDS